MVTHFVPERSVKITSSIINITLCQKLTFFTFSNQIRVTTYQERNNTITLRCRYFYNVGSHHRIYKLDKKKEILKFIV